jgi:hypothetical protein
MTDHTTPTRTPPSAEQIRAMTQIMQEAASWHEPRVISIPGMLGPITAGPVRGFREPRQRPQRQRSSQSNRHQSRCSMRALCL